MPKNEDVKSTVLKRLLISKMFPIPRLYELCKKISICHFIIIAPKIKPIKNRISENGMYFVTNLNSLIFKAGFKKFKTWAIINGKVIIKPVAIPQLIARLIN